MDQTRINLGHLLLGILKETEEVESARETAIAQGVEQPIEFIGVAARIVTKNTVKYDIDRF